MNKLNPVFNHDLNTGWTDFYGNGTTFHTTIPGEYIKGKGGIKLNLATSNTGMRFNTGSLHDWSNKSFKLWLKASNWDDIEDAKLNLLETSNLSGNYFQVYLKTFLTSATDHNNEWFEITIPQSAFSIGLGTPTWNNIQYIIIQGKAKTGTTPIMYVDDFRVIPNPLSVGLLTICFDDGHDSNYTYARESMDKYGWFPTLFLAPELVDTTNFLTQEQVDELAKIGWEIACHADTNLTTLAIDDLVPFLDEIEEYFDECGFSGREFFAYPNGGWNDLVISEIRRRFEYARTIIGQNQPGGDLNPYLIHGRSIGFSTSVSTVQGYIDKAIASKEWLILTFHRIRVSGSTGIEYNQADLELILDYAKTQGIQVVTFGQGISQIAR